MSQSLEIRPVAVPIDAVVQPPGSKSITNRALACAALAEDCSTLRGALDSDDTRVMIAGLRTLGIDIAVDDGGSTLTAAGCAGRPPAAAGELFVGNSGTTIRFLTALATLGNGRYRLDGGERMRERPIGDLLDALNQLGASVRSERDNNCPPVLVDAQGLPGGKAQVRGDISSQYLSGLLMAAPAAENAVTLRVAGTLVSIPYVAMTLSVMKAFGVEATCADDFSEISLPRKNYQGRDYQIEPDASAASYFWAAAAVTGGRVKVTNLGRNSLQGDVAFVDCLAQMGCQVRFEEDGITVVGRPLRGIDVDMNAISDTVQTLAVVALFADGPTTIRNIGHIRHKETDRIAAAAAELRKLGAHVIEHADALEIIPGALRGAEIATYDDHRMAMSFAVAGLVQPGVVICDPECTAKTYPRFFEDLEALTR